jgi:hypothetical protein
MPEEVPSALKREEASYQPRNSISQQIEIEFCTIFCYVHTCFALRFISSSFF